jgi:ribosomal protein S11
MLKKKKSIKKVKRLTNKETKKFVLFFQRNNYILKNNSQKILNYKNPKYLINIKIIPNNIFCVLRDLVEKQTKVFISGGLLKLNVSKKKHKFLLKIIIENFINRICKQLQNSLCILTVVGPIKIKKQAIRFLVRGLKSVKLLINPIEKKVFNGCRAKKKKRKKRLRFRIFK